MNVDVKKIELLFPKEVTVSLLDKLQTEGVLEIIEKKNLKNEDNPSRADYNLKLSEVNFAINFLEKFKPQESFAKSLLFSFVSQKETLTKEELDKIVSSKDVTDVVQKTATTEEKINKLETRKEELTNEINVIRKFQKTSVVREKDLKSVSFFAGSVAKKDKDSLLEDLKSNDNFYIEEGEEDIFSYSFVIYYPQKEGKRFFDLLSKYNAKEDDVFWSERPELALKEREKERKEVSLELDIQKKEAQKLVLQIPKMQAVSDWLFWQIEKENFLQKAEKTNKYISAVGWIAKEDIERVRELAKNETDYFLIKEVPLQEDDYPPVIVKNKGVVGSFGIVTGVYGLPKSDEVDPTPFLAPFFIFYFALALSDSGYGILLATLAFLAKKMFKKANADKFFNLFIFCGLLTALIGVFVGTVFGSDVLESFRIADPMGDPIAALMFVLALGVLQIFIGLIIGMVWLIKQQKTKEAISGNGASITFFIGAILFLAFGNINFMISGVALMAVLAFVYADGSSFFARLGKAFGSLYGLIGFIGDILSYSRILALGLATGIIASVINMMAVIFMEMVPVPGINVLIAGIVLVVGHIGNLLINALGAFIHSARLQFVEFFSKFMEGGGRYFKPLAKNGRFIKINN